MENLINRIVFEIGCPDEDQAFGLRHKLSQTLQHELTAGIDHICEKHKTKKPVRIPNLALDLGEFNAHTFDRHILDVLLHRFEEALVIQLKELDIHEHEGDNVPSQLESLFHFLETGQLAWWESGNSTDFNQYFLHYLKSREQEVLRFLKRHEENDRLWNRISLQFGPEVHEKLVKKTPSLLQSSNLISKWAKAISEALDLKSQTATPQLINKLVVGQRVAINGLHQLEERSMQLFKTHMKELVQKIQTPHRSTIAQIIEMLVGKVAEANEGGTSKRWLPRQEAHGDQDTFRSDHGGAVLLCQFLKPLFKNLGFYEDGKWKEGDSQAKAAHLVNYMCTGETQAPEHGLTLEKLLCGLPLNAPIPLDAKLSEAELQEADLLLASIIEHWQVLKNTSISGLQHTFLRRESKLSQKGSHWNIYLERKTEDVLLDKLPWGYSIIILPWNDYQIYVEW